MSEKTTMMRVVVKKPGKDPEVQWIDNSLEAMQKIVEGSIELVGVFQYPISLFCNEEGKLMELRPNIKIGSDIIVGTLFVCSTDDEGDSISLTEQQAGMVINQLKLRAVVRAY